MLIIVLLLSFIFGYLVVAALRAHDEPWRGRELFWSLLIGICVTGWLGQILADLQWFSLPAILSVLVIGSGGLAIWLRGRIVPWGLRPAWREIAGLVVLLGLGAILFFQPAEMLLGSRDDGTRLMSGTIVARDGGWLRRMPLPRLIPRTPGLENDIKYLGVEILDPQQHLSVLQFTGAYEVWQAIAFGTPREPLTAAVNLRAAHPFLFYLNPLLALIGLVACYTLGREIWGSTAALIGALLLAINVAEVWYARQFMAEVLLQVLLLGGIATGIAYLRRPDRATALATGLAFGVALLTKVDTLIALALLGVVAIVVWPRRGRWPHLGWLFVPLVGCFAHYVAHSLWFSTTYFSYNLANLFADPRLIIVVLAAIGGLGALLALRLRSGLRRRVDALLTRPLGSRWRVALLTALVLLVGYAYFVRPTALAQEGFFHPLWQERVLTYRGLNLVLLAAYLTPLGFALGLAGLMRFVLRDMRWSDLPFLALGLGYGLLFQYNAMVAGDQPFWVRRFLPVVIPGALLLAGSALVVLFRARAWWRWSAPILLALTIGWSAWQTMPVAALDSGNGLAQQLAGLAGDVPPNAVVLFQDWEAAFSIAAPLELLYGRESYQLNGQPLSGDLVRRWYAQLEEWMRAGRPIIYVATDGRLTVPPEGLDWQPLANHTIRYRTIETTHDRVPSQPVEISQQLSLYRIVDAPRQAIGCSDAVEIGGDDYGAIGAGFYGSEKIGTQEVRWSQGTASIAVPPVSGDGDVLVTLKLFNNRPVQAGPAEIRFSAEGRDLGAQRLIEGWHSYTVRIPAQLATQNDDPLLLSWNVPAWSPQAFGQADARNLGVLADAFTARRASCTLP